MEENTVHDVIIIGGGPAGASCAIYTSRARLTTLVLDKSASAGALGLTSKIANYPGVRGEVQGLALVETMRAQAKDFGSEFARSTVVGVDFEMEPKVIYTSDSVYAARTVVVATGSMGRKARVPGEEKLIGRGVSYCATCDAAFYIDKEVAVVGDSDLAVEESLFLTRFARRVHLIVSHKELQSWRELTAAVVENPSITIHYQVRLAEIVGDDMVGGLQLAEPTGDVDFLPVDGVFILLTGTSPTTDFLAGALPLTENGCIQVDTERNTPIPGVYAIGDVTCTHIKQAAVAAADGVIAALSIDKYLNRRERVRVDYYK